MEVFLQVSLQIIVLLLNKTDTATTSGLQTFFQQTSINGIDSTVILRKALKTQSKDLPKAFLAVLEKVLLIHFLKLDL